MSAILKDQMGILCFALWVQCNTEQQNSQDSGCRAEAKIMISCLLRDMITSYDQWSCQRVKPWVHMCQCSRLTEKYGKAEASCNATPLNKQAATQMARVPELALATALIFVWKYLSTNVWKYFCTDVWKWRDTRCMCATTTPKITQELWRSFVNLSQLNKQCS